jgi:hypothetical protein
VTWNGEFFPALSDPLILPSLNLVLRRYDYGGDDGDDLFAD